VTGHCAPCLTRFTYLVQLESEAEQRAVLAATGLSRLTNQSVVLNPTHGPRSDSVLREYLGQLSCGTVAALYSRYYPDFILFNYTLHTVQQFVNRGAGCKF